MCDREAKVFGSFFKTNSCLLLLLFFTFPAFAFDPQSATEAYLKSVPAAAKLKSDAYFEGGYWLLLWSALYAVATYVFLLATGLSARMRDVAFGGGRRRWLAVAIYSALFTVISAVLSLPMDIYQGFFREHAYNLSNQSLGAWFGDAGINLAVSVVVSALVLPFIYAAIRAAPRLWWLWGTGVVVVFLAVIVILGPVFLEPLLNHFQPLPDGPLRTQILAMAHSNGVPATDVKEYDSSRQTNRISAHVSGAFGTTQISLTDNLVKQGSPDEALAIVGHEMGHYVMGHVFNYLLLLSFITAGGFLFTRVVFSAVIGQPGRWGVRDIADPAGLPILVSAATIYGLLLTPVTNTLTRQQEMQADLFGLNLARKPDAFATAILKLSTYRKLDPSSLEEFVFYDHPSGRTRIFTAMRWKSEQMAATHPAP